MKKLLNIFLAVMFVSMLVFAAPSRTYTNNADFDEGTLVGVEHTTVADQLQLTVNADTLPFIWVPNMQGTISKVDTVTGDEIGRYWVSPAAGSPSRTTVDLNGNCWVGNRNMGTVVKVGLSEAGQCVDRNGDGIIQTSTDLNNDGDITGAEILPWGADECVIVEVVLYGAGKGPYVPGTYSGSYSSSPGPRGIAIDASNNLWAGNFGTQEYYYINGNSGAILNHLDVAPWGHKPYGAVVDSNGIVWSSGDGSYSILRIDPSTTPMTVTKLSYNHWVYGLGLDSLGHLFFSGWTNAKIGRVDINTGTTDWVKPGIYQARGVAVTADNNVWLASTSGNSVARYDNDGNLLATIPAGNGPTGVAVDAAGKVWEVNYYDDTIRRIDPATNSVDLTKNLIGSGFGGGYHYGYSDMTGIIARSQTTKLGTWTVDHDGGAAGTAWSAVSWNSNEPTGTTVIVRVRSSEDKSTWSGWEVASNGGALSVPAGRYLQIESKLQILSGDTSPILYDLTVNPTSGDVPEFGVIASSIVLALAGLFIFYRRRR